uniref:Uncharacterized protein n=1 Tax=Panagrolaimus sp. PS1159 TaxID=55785 RepID=A0AC35GS70_9BILA
MEPKQGIVWHLNTHEIKRHRQKRFIKKNNEDKVIGLAKQCGYSCTFRLKSDFINPLSDIINDEKELKVFFERWQQVAKPISKKNRDIRNGQVIPLIQYMDNDEETHARLSKVSPNCLYTASVDGTNEKGIVNLCEKHGGLELKVFFA